VESFAYIFLADSVRLFSLFAAGSENKCVLTSKVIEFGSNRKRVRDFLLVRHSNLGPIFPRFNDIAGVLLMTPPVF